MENRFDWINFYQAFADKLYEYKDNQAQLTDMFKNYAQDKRLLQYLNFENLDRWPENRYVDPFTIFGSFNRKLKVSNRIKIIEGYRDLFNMNVEIPTSFAGIPILNNMQSFYGNSNNIIWDLFVAVMDYSANGEISQEFQDSFSQAIQEKGNGLASITMGLFWIRPQEFIALDSRNRQYLDGEFGLDFQEDMDLKEYFDFIQEVQDTVGDISFPELSHQANKYTKTNNSPNQYHPNLSTEEWEELLKNPEVFNEKRLTIMKRMKDIGGKATCTQLSNKYGENVNFYNRGSSALAEEVYKATGCKLYDENGQTRWWRILYTGEENKDNSEGSYYWILRKELSDALDRINLDGIDLYTPENSHVINEPTRQKQYWWVNANPKIWSFTSIDVGEEVEYSIYNADGNKRRIFNNYLNAKIGDQVICYETNPTKKVISLGVITKEADDDSIKIKKTEDLLNPIDYSEFRNTPELENFEFFKNGNGSIFKIEVSEYQVMMEIIGEANPPYSTTNNIPSYDKEDFLKDVYLSEAKYDSLVGLLKNKMNVILYGPPGVGKTYAARRLAWSIMGQKDDSKIEMIQFHQNYSYEDFILGYKPVGEGFELKEGLFLNFCKKAANDKGNKYFLIIDEINRGNMSKIFGELLMLIEKDYRGDKLKLPYNGQMFSVPDNIYIIGMMNTADRSLAMIDYALRRRFSFFEMKAGFESHGFQDYQNQLANENFNQLISLVKNLNRVIEEDPSLGSGFCIGHSYFSNPTESTDEWIRLVVDYDIIPMLSEYWFDEVDKVREWSDRLRSLVND